jgi:hypothetical protein
MMKEPVLRVPAGPAFASARAWRGWMMLCLAGVSPLAGCYSTRPVTSAPEPGTTVQLDLNDHARVQLGDRIGPAASRIEGIVQVRNDTAYMLRVSSVQYLNGQSNKWSGESLTVPAILVSGARIREFSRSRTTAVGVGIAAAIITLFAKTKFLGLGGTERQPKPPPGGES